MIALSVGDHGLVERAVALYGPVAFAFVSWSLKRPRTPVPPTQTASVFCAGLLGLLWCLPALLLLQRLNIQADWWSFSGSDGVRMLGMPLELWLGWALLWGVVPIFWLGHARAYWVAATLLVFDLVGMPLCTATIVLSSRWLVGEAVGLALVLLPILWLQRATLQRQHVRGRAAMQVLTAGLVFLYLPAELVFFARGGDWSVVWAWLPWQRGLLVQLGLFLALPGLAAVHEFAVRGGGTPIPYDPPLRLVRSGVYRYIANPMQFACVLVMLLWALALRNAWMLIGASLCVVYSAGIAAWDENLDLARRFGVDWMNYRAAVPQWRFRWRPYVAEAATVYIARRCAPCSRVRLWLEARTPVSLRIEDAETLPTGSIRRMRYVCGDETVEGVRAMARCLEHLNAGWMLLGAAMRLPVVNDVAQAVADAMGFGPRVLVCDVAVRTNDAA